MALQLFSKAREENGAGDYIIYCSDILTKKQTIYQQLNENTSTYLNFLKFINFRMQKE